MDSAKEHPLSAGGTLLLLIAVAAIATLSAFLLNGDTADTENRYALDFYADKLGGHPFGYSETGVEIDQAVGVCRTSVQGVADAYPEVVFEAAGNTRRKRATADDHSRKNRIVGGAATRVQEFPWQVSLHTGGAHVCGGSIILSDWVLTAAHCTNVFDQAGDWTVYAGLDRSTATTSGEKRDVTAILQHASFNENDFDNDISLLKLNQPLTYSGKIQPVCLPTSGSDSTYYDDAPNNLDCFVSGYGSIFAGGPASDALNSVKVPQLQNQLCNDWFYESTDGQALNWVYDNMVCAGYEEGRLDGCQGDSGGPLQCVRKTDSAALHQAETWYQVGLVSWGIGCADAKKPGVYARVGTFYGWVWDQIAAHEGL